MSRKRSIFEEVQDGQRSGPVAAAVGSIDRVRGSRGAVQAWLITLGVLVVAMIVIGGLTRLTDSGLSITNWRPLSGAIPPLNAADWQLEFDAYRASPQYIHMNAGMSLEEFKFIFWWEWGHRQLGRIVGLVWAIGFVALWVTKKIPAGWVPRMIWVGVLGGLQGAIGWWMVSSGLEGERTSVASYRLATHLGLAFLILGYIFWYVLLLGRSEAELMKARRAGEQKLFGMTTGLMHLTMAQILLGALVAGIDAGRGYTDWPLMAGGVFPPGMWDLTPVWRNFFENDGTVQFIHRLVGYLLFAFAVVVTLRGRRSPHAATRSAYTLAGALVFLQMVMGVVTVMHSSPLHIAIFHQIGAILVFAAVLRARFLARFPIERSLRA